jgi:uncharacterized protein
VTLADVNVLIYAFRQDSSHHTACKAWLEGTIAGNARFAVSPLVLSGVIRITTNPKAYREPSTLEEAFGFCSDLLSQPHCQIVRSGDRHWQIFTELCLETGIRGSDISDAWFAALAIEHGCTLITYDRGFARFSGLDWKLPAA